MLSVFEFILNISLPECVSYFYVAVIKYPDKRNLGEKNIYLFIDFIREISFIMTGKTPWSRRVASMLREQRVMNAHCLTVTLLHSLSRISDSKWYHTQWVVSPLQLA